MSAHTITLHRVLRAPPERVYRAFLEPAALAKWFPPNGFTAQVHALQAQVGGSYRMSFTHFASGHTHTFGGEYLELTSPSRIRYTSRFDDPSLASPMQTTVVLRAVDCGTDLSVEQAGIPEAIPPDACHLGWQECLSALALLVESSGPA